MLEGNERSTKGSCILSRVGAALEMVTPSGSRPADCVVLQTHLVKFQLLLEPLDLTGLQNAVSVLVDLVELRSPGTQNQVTTAHTKHTQAGSMLILRARGAVARPLYQNTSLKTTGGMVNNKGVLSGWYCMLFWGPRGSAPARRSPAAR